MRKNKPKLLSTNKYKIVSEIYQNDPDLKAMNKAWSKKFKMIYVSEHYFGLGVEVTVKRYLQSDGSFSKSMYMSCQCCGPKKLKDQMQFHFSEDKEDSSIEANGSFIDSRLFARLLSPILKLKLKDEIKL